MEKNDRHGVGLRALWPSDPRHRGRAEGGMTFWMATIFGIALALPVAVDAMPHGPVSAQQLRHVLPAFAEAPRGWQETNAPPSPFFHVHHWPDPVNAFNGNLFLVYQDLSIPARGYPLEVSRAYNSRGTTQGLFGWGWTSTLETGIRIQSDGSLRVDRWDGSAEIYRSEPQAMPGGDRRYRADRSVADVVVRRANGVFVRSVGAGLQEEYSPRGKMARKGDLLGNGISFQYDRQGRPVLIADPTGRQVRIAYNPVGLVAAVTDFAGRRVSYVYDAQDNLISVTGGAGERTRFAYDADHNLTEILLPDGGRIVHAYDRKRDWVIGQEGPGEGKTSYSYSTAGIPPVQETVVIDPLGNKTVYAYRFNDGKVKSLTINDAAGRRIVEEYDDRGQVVSRTEPGDRRTRFTYTPEGWPRSIIDPLGHRWVFEYLPGCSCKRMTTITDPLGRMTALHYDKQLRVSRLVNPCHQETTFAYSQEGDLTEVTVPLGGKTTYRYDRYGYLAGITGPEAGSVGLRHDRLGRLTEMHLPNGQIYRFRYDAKGRLVETANPLGHRVTLAYDGRDRVVKIREGDGEFAYAYDQAGRLVHRRDPEGNSWEFAYDRVGNLIRQVDPLQQEWRFSYDRRSRLQEILDPLSRATRFAYGPSGFLQEIIDPLKARVLFSHDANGNPTELIDSLGNRSRLEYDAAGQLTAVFDAEGNQTGFVYDAAGRIVEIRNALGGTMSFERDASGNVVRRKNPAGDMTSFRYDKAGRIREKTDPGGHVWKMSYDASGRLDRWRKPDGKSVGIQYNPLSRPIRIAPDGEDPIHFFYDKKGRMIEATAGPHRTRYQYDRRDLLVSMEDLRAKKQIRYRYDALLRRTVMEMKPNGSTVQYRYDALGKVTEIHAAPGQTYRLAYDDAGRRTSLVYPNGVRTAYRYDAAGRLVERQVAGPDGSLYARDSYTHDRLGLVLTRTDERQQTVRYRHDPLFRLTEAISSDGTWERFSYDAMGNIRRYENEKGVRHREYDEMGRLVSTDEERLVYDRNGNLVSRSGAAGRTEYRWDALHRLREIALPDGTRKAYAYGPAGERIRSKEGKEERHTLYDGFHPIATLDGAGKIATQFVHGPDFGEILAQVTPEGPQYFHRDLVGNIVGVTDGAGARAVSLAYTSFGSPRVLFGALPAVSFAGQRHDPDIGLTSFHFREYDAAVGRFLQPDPLGVFAGWENAYAYAGNNPINFIDPYGLLSATQFFCGAAIAAGVIAAGIAIAAAAPVIAAGSGVAAGLSAAGTALGAAASAAGGAVAASAGAIKTAALIGGAGGAVVSGMTAATSGKGFPETVRDVVVGGAMGVGAGAASAVGGAMFFAGEGVAVAATGVWVSMVGGGTAGAIKAGLTGGNVDLNITLGSAGSLIGAATGPVFEGGGATMEGVKSFGVGAAQGGVGDLIESVINSTNCN